MDQYNPEAIKEQSKRLGMIIDANYEKDDSEQDVSKLTHLTNFQRVLLLGYLKFYEGIFDGNIGECNRPTLDISLKY